jgi:rSAM/selenodomain-associated transferase 1
MNQQIPKTNLLYFLKYPQAGKVKTRLAAEIGDKKAALIYKRLAEINLRTLYPLLNADLSLTIQFDPPESETKVKEWLSGNYAYSPQTNGDLDKRLKSAFKDAFDQGSEMVIAIGSDSLNLKSELIRQTQDKLHKNDLVIGPAQDGGYYLIGLSKYEPILFENISWSTSSVFNQTVQNAKDLALTYETLEPLEDLDDFATLKKHRYLFSDIMPNL